MILTDFIVHQDKVYVIGTDVEETIDENNKERYCTNLITITNIDNQFSIESIKNIDNSEDRQYWFSDVIVKDKYLYAASQGYRDLNSKERNMNSTIYRYDLENDDAKFFSN